MKTKSKDTDKTWLETVNDLRDEMRALSERLSAILPVPEQDDEGRRQLVSFRIENSLKATIVNLLSEIEKIGKELGVAQAFREFEGDPSDFIGRIIAGNGENHVPRAREITAQCIDQIKKLKNGS